MLKTRFKSFRLVTSTAVLFLLVRLWRTTAASSWRQTDVSRPKKLTDAALLIPLSLQTKGNIIPGADYLPSYRGMMSTRGRISRQVGTNHHEQTAPEVHDCRPVTRSFEPFQGLVPFHSLNKSTFDRKIPFIQGPRRRLYCQYALQLRRPHIPSRMRFHCYGRSGYRNHGSHDSYLP